MQDKHRHYPINLRSNGHFKLKDQSLDTALSHSRNVIKYSNTENPTRQVSKPKSVPYKTKRHRKYQAPSHLRHPKSTKSKNINKTAIGTEYNLSNKLQAVFPDTTIDNRLGIGEMLLNNDDCNLLADADSNIMGDIIPNHIRETDEILTEKLNFNEWSIKMQSSGTSRKGGFYNSTNQRNSNPQNKLSEAIADVAPFNSNYISGGDDIIMYQNIGNMLKSEKKIHGDNGSNITADFNTNPKAGEKCNSSRGIKSQKSEDVKRINNTHDLINDYSTNNTNVSGSSNVIQLPVYPRKKNNQNSLKNNKPPMQNQSFHNDSSTRTTVASNKTSNKTSISVTKDTNTNTNTNTTIHNINVNKHKDPFHTSQERENHKNDISTTYNHPPKKNNNIKPNNNHNHNHNLLWKENDKSKLTIMKYLKILFGEQFEDFNENVLFEKLDETSLKDVFKQLSFLALNQENIIKENMILKQKLEMEIKEKNKDIKDLSTQMIDIKKNLIGLINTTDKITNKKSPGSNHSLKIQKKMNNPSNKDINFFNSN